MRTLWTALSVLAVANALALAGFIGWLKATDRLDSARVAQVRTVFTKTLTQEKSEEEEAKAKAQCS